MNLLKITYYNIVYGFDIETTKTDDVTTHYLSNFSSVDFNLFKADNETIINNISGPLYCRTADDVNNALENINKLAEKNNVYIIIFIHNLAYEFTWLVHNVPFVHDNFDNNNALFIKPRIPLFFRCKNIEFRCSYKLLNKSLKSCGEMLNYNKLEIDYNSKYYRNLPQFLKEAVDTLHTADINAH